MAIHYLRWEQRLAGRDEKLPGTAAQPRADPRPPAVLTSATPPGPPALHPCPPGRPPPGTPSPLLALALALLRPWPALHLSVSFQPRPSPSPHFHSSFWGPFSPAWPYCLVSLSLLPCFFLVNTLAAFVPLWLSLFCHFLVSCFCLSLSAPSTSPRLPSVCSPYPCGVLKPVLWSSCLIPLPGSPCLSIYPHSYGPHLQASRCPLSQSRVPDHRLEPGRVQQGPQFGPAGCGRELAVWVL